MKAWRLQHPKATLSEIELALDERLGRVRARLLLDLALARSAADIKAAQEQERPVCPKCGSVLESRGQHERQLTTHHNQALKLERSYGACPTCGAGFFLLDDELGLLAGVLTPSLQEDVARLGTWMPFERAVVELQHFRRTDVSRPTVERITEVVGAAYVKVQEQEVERLEHEAPVPPAGPAQSS
jgi:ribosomal protein S27AE